MNFVVGVFKSRSEAEVGTEELLRVGIRDRAITVLTPQRNGGPQRVPKSDAEQPGMMKTLGAVAGGALGLGVGEGLATLIIPGVGPVLAAGMIGGAVLGALAGGAVAGSHESAIFPGLPGDEVFIYRDALRQGRTVLIVAAESPEEAKEVQVHLERAGAESIDSARRMWWLGLRDLEKEHYNAGGGNFERDEADFKRGFEAALHDGHDVDERKTRPDTWNSEAFQEGYERGRQYADSARKITDAA